MEVSTRGQSCSKIWMEERKKRITSSHFGDICKSTAQRDKKTLASNLITPREFDARSVAHGRQYEKTAAEKFESLVGEKIQECGLIVHKHFPFLAASPDRLYDENAVVEIKCPYSARSSKITPVTVPYLKYDKDGNLQLSKHHNYFYQVQGQLVCTDRNICYFCIFTFVDFVVLKIVRDDEFCTDMLDKLKLFFHEHFNPTLMNKYVYNFYDKYLA